MLLYCDKFTDMDRDNDKSDDGDDRKLVLRPILGSRSGRQAR